MHTHALTTAITLYENGTLTLTQAAKRAGRTPDAMEAALRAHGVDLSDETPTTVSARPDRPACAD
jgi:predicted HTH domain antitoxin